MGPRLLINAIISVGAVGLSLAATPADGLTGYGGDLTGHSDCESPGRFVSAEWITKDGGRIASPVASVKEAVDLWRASASEGLVVHYSAGGADVEQIIPPVGWSPAKGNAAERALYGGTGPMDEAEASLTPAGPGEICGTARNNAVTHTQVMTNWGGGMNVNGSQTANTYWKAQLRWYQPSFYAVCPAASTYATWSGLGGYNSGKLIQSGSNASQASVSGAYFWWEMLNPTNSLPEPSVSSPSVRAGDYVGTVTEYSAGSAKFKMMNFTLGTSTTYTVATAGGQQASSFYEGTTSDYVTEPSSGGSGPYGLYYLRKPTAAVSFPYALANDQAIADFASWRLNTASAAGGYKQGTYYDGIHSWTNEWYSCS